MYMYSGLLECNYMQMLAIDCLMRKVSSRFSICTFIHRAVSLGRGITVGWDRIKRMAFHHSKAKLRISADTHRHLLNVCVYCVSAGIHSLTVHCMYIQVQSCICLIE